MEELKMHEEELEIHENQFWGKEGTAGGAGHRHAGNQRPTWENSLRK
jgi:hypothetical protein